MKIPSQNGQFKVKHGKDYFADIVRTRNLSFDQDGFLQLGRKPMSIYNANDSGSFSKVVAIVPDDSAGYFYIGTSSRVFYMVPSPLAITIATATTHPSMSAGSDGCTYNAIAHFSGTTTVHSYVVDTWTSRITGLSASYPHPLASFEDRLDLSVGNGNTVQNYNTSYVLQNTLTIPAQYVVTSLRWRGGKMYVGTRHIYGGEAKLFLWDGAGTTAPTGYGVGAVAIFSLAEFQSSMAVMTSGGQLLRFNGGGFDELAHLPVYETPYAWGPVASVAAASYDLVPNRGMQAQGSRLFINLKGDLNISANFPPGVHLPNQPSGLWVYEPSVGLYHRAGHQHNEYKTLTVTALNSSILTVGTYSITTGDPVLAQSVGNITGLSQYQTYYCIPVTSTTLQLAFSRADALAGRALTLSGTPSGDTLRVDDTTSFGATSDTIAGAVHVFTSQIFNPFYATSVIFGCEPINSTNTTTRSLNTLGLQANRGYFITTPIPAAGVFDFFQKLYLLIDNLTYAADAVVVKYRTMKRTGMPTPQRTNDTGLATWTSTTTFTVDTTKKDVRSAAVGDEVEIISGSASGYMSKITVIDTSTSIYTFTVADVMPVSVSDKSEIIIEDWTVLNAFDNTSGTINKGYLEIALGQNNSLIQFKIELRGYDVRTRGLSAVTKVDKPTL